MLSDANSSGHRNSCTLQLSSVEKHACLLQAIGRLLVLSRMIF